VRMGSRIFTILKLVLGLCRSQDFEILYSTLGHLKSVAPPDDQNVHLGAFQAFLKKKNAFGGMHVGTDQPSVEMGSSFSRGSQGGSGSLLFIEALFKSSCSLLGRVKSVAPPNDQNVHQRACQACLVPKKERIRRYACRTDNPVVAVGSRILQDSRVGFGGIIKKFISFQPSPILIWVFCTLTTAIFVLSSQKTCLASEAISDDFCTDGKFPGQEGHSMAVSNLM